MSQKTIVNGLWLGRKQLSPLELLTLKSFERQGAEFHLWVYDNSIGPIPKGTVVRDGNEILPESMIFRYPSSMVLGFGHNSYVGFSEVFRYKVLYEKGGWWSDMDITCLKPLEEITDDYWFRFHGVLSIVGNIMKCPPKSELMRLCFERAVVEVNSQQNDWHHAIRILCYYVEFLGLSKFIHYDKCNIDRVDWMNKFVSEERSMKDINPNWHFLHWMNSLIDKSYKCDSVFYRLLEEHDCKPKPMLI